MEIAGVLVGEYFHLLDVEIPLEGITVLFGPNGAGKSSILNALNGWGEDSTDLDTGVVLRLQQEIDVDVLLHLLSDGAFERWRVLDRRLSGASYEIDDEETVYDLELKERLEGLIPEDRSWDGLLQRLAGAVEQEEVDPNPVSELMQVWGEHPLVAIGKDRAWRPPEWDAYIGDGLEVLHVSVDLVVDTRRIGASRFEPSRDAGSNSPGSEMARDVDVFPRVFEPFHRLGYVPAEDIWPPAEVFKLSRDPSGLVDHVQDHVGPIFERLLGSTAGRGLSEPMRFRGLGDPWLDEAEDTEDGEKLFRLRAGIRDVVGEIEKVTNELLPDFLREDAGRVVISVTHPTQWAQGRVTLRYEHALGSFQISDVSAGMQRWIAAALREACRRLSTLRRTELTDLERGETLTIGDDLDEEAEAALVYEFVGGRALTKDEVRYRIPEGSGVLVIDEPELHLHPLAQRDVAAWLLERSREGLRVLIATHSPEFLSFGQDGSEYLRVQASPEGVIATPVGGKLLETLRDSARDAGLHPIHALQVTEKILVVEGRHDELVLRAFFGQELVSQRVLLLRMEGLRNAFALAEAEYLALLSVPMRVLADNSTTPSIGKDSTWEEQVGHRLMQLVEDRDLDLRFVPYEDPDIMCALPSPMVKRAWPEAAFDGWEPIIEEWRLLNIPNFKGFALNKMELPSVGATEFIRRVIAARTGGDRPRANLRRAMKEALAS